MFCMLVWVWIFRNSPLGAEHTSSIKLPPVHIRLPSCAVCENVRALTDVSEPLLWAGASTFEVAWLVMVQVGEV